MQSVKLRFLLVILSLAFGGCSVTDKYQKLVTVVNNHLHGPDTNLYLRGSMSFWDAVPEFRLTPTKNGRYAVAVELFADGGVYEFKVADQNWSKEYNCGSSHSVKHLRLNAPSQLNCDANSHNLSFKPSKSGVYLVELSFTQKNPELVIRVL